PISTDLLLCLITALQQGCFNVFNDIVMETLCLTAAFGFLRCAEFSTPSTSSFPALGLKRSDLSQSPETTLSSTSDLQKTVHLSQGFSIFRRIPSSSTAPDLYVTRHWFSSRLCTLLSRIGLSSNYFSPHSFWIGAGINQHLIKSMGRWISSAVKLYIRSSSADIATAHQALVSLPGVGGALSARSTRGFLPAGGFPLHSADGL
ncbi:hypothetical protein HHUSO_G26938, partial [Huso huso]